MSGVSPTVQTAQQLLDRIGDELYTVPNADLMADIVASIASIGGGGGSMDSHFEATVTFDGTAGNGAEGDVIIGHVTGRVRQRSLWVKQLVVATTSGTPADVEVDFLSEGSGLGTTHYTVDQFPTGADEIAYLTGTSFSTDHEGPNLIVADSQDGAVEDVDLIIRIAGGDVITGTYRIDFFYAPVDDGAVA